MILFTITASHPPGQIVLFITANLGIISLSHWLQKRILTPISMVRSPLNLKPHLTSGYLGLITII